MCILCVVQKWSRKVATMLPWLVIPLIGLWALSQLLPPAFRFEITSPRLACVLVLLVTLFWYEVLMPQLSAWRIRRNARLRERKRIEAIEMHKLRKTATRRCRNCLTPYRDQNPGGGKFMCSYCGHISKRPVLDLPASSGMGNSGILKDLVGKGGKILNGKAWDNGWICGQDWLENGNWSGGPVTGNSSNWTKNGSGIFGSDDQCPAEKSYSSFFISACKYFTAFFLSVMRLWRKIFRVSSSGDDTAADAECKRMLDKQGENGGIGQESRGEKARRKAEEKRQARLEKELMEEEERKQREEVARLVEERRKLRDEKMEAGREGGKGSPRAKERDSKREAERKRRERKKERDRGSSKSNSDVEELDKKAGKDNDRNKKSVSDRRDQHKNTPESVKTHGTEVGIGSKSVAAGSHSRGNAGTRYLDRMKGTFLSSSRAFSGGGLFGKSTSTSTVSREHKPPISIDHTQSSMQKKEILQPDVVSGRSNVNGDDKFINRPVLAEPSQCPAPKKSWQQLFTRSSAVSPPSNSSVISRPDEKCQAEVHTPIFPSPPRSTQAFDNPINYGLPSPFNLPSFSIGPSTTTTHLPSSSEPMFPKTRNVSHQFLPEDSEIFEDPCYVPDPVSLLGPVSESLDDFQLDCGFVKNKGMEKPCGVKPSEITRPSPIESPLSRLKVSEERHPTSYLFPSTPRAPDNPSNITDNRTWQMWNSSPLGQDGLGLAGGPANWLFPPDVNVQKNDDMIHPVPHKTMASLFKNDEKVTPATHSSQNALFGNCQNGGTFNSLPPGVDSRWLPKAFGGLTSSNQILLNPHEQAAQSGHPMYGNSSGPTGNHQFEMSPSNSWSNKDGTAVGSTDAIRNSPIGSRAHVGGLYSTPDVHSLWSYPKKS